MMKNVERLIRNFTISKIRDAELAIFCQQLATLLGAGISIVEALQLAAGSVRQKHLKKSILTVRNAIRQGYSLSQSMQQHPKCFPEFLIQMVYVGEISGQLEKVFKNLGTYYERQHTIRQSLISASVYPVCVGIVALVVVAFLLTFVLPVFANIFEQMGAETPIVTQLLLQIGNGLKLFWPLVLTVIIILVILDRVVAHDVKLRQKRDHVVLKIPFFGILLIKAEIIRISETLAMLLDSGVDILRALQAISSVTGNFYIRYSLRKLRQYVKNGTRLSESLQDEKIYPNGFIDLVKIGEVSGQLDQTLKKAAAFYSKEVEKRVRMMIRIIEPVILLVVGLVVFFIVLSVMLPILEIYTGYSNML